MRAVGRYAPSPTGALHLGNLRTALAAWLSIRAQRGRFLLRIEDIDRARSKPEWEARQLQDLERLGLDWDETPLRQSERLDRYEDALKAIEANGDAFPCFCSRKDLREASSAPHEDGAEVPYPGTCETLPSGERECRISSGKQHAMRHRIPPDAGRATVSDLIAGDVAVDLSQNGGAFVLKRADGEFAYQLACAVDDGAQGITEVLRGADLLVSAARQALILERLGGFGGVPRYAHLGMMLDADGARLSKRAGSADLSAFAAKGIDAVAVRSYLAHTLGICSRGERAAAGTLIDRWRTTAELRHNVRFHEETLADFA